jgi:hypothetical protein
VALSLAPSDENQTRKGFVEKALKKEYGARFTSPLRAIVEIQPIGRGATIALNGSCGRPCPLAGS